ncbi:MAG: META domain-containing protein [Pseudomonadales bacterium]|nr:META domain-containing protein [Pseudomonadales bacterium]
MASQLKKFFIIVVSGIFTANSTFAQENTLENTSWQLVAIYGFNDTEFLPDNPESYLLRFRLDNRLQIEADCNQAGASWEQDETSLNLSEMVTTRKLCVQPSLFNRYIMYLDLSATYELENDRLVIKTNTESDWMVFEPYVFTPSF